MFDDMYWRCAHLFTQGQAGIAKRGSYLVTCSKRPVHAPHGFAQLLVDGVVVLKLGQAVHVQIRHPLPAVAPTPRVLVACGVTRTCVEVVANADRSWLQKRQVATEKAAGFSQ